MLTVLCEGEVVLILFSNWNGKKKHIAKLVTHQVSEALLICSSNECSTEQEPY